MNRGTSSARTRARLTLHPGRNLRRIIAGDGGTPCSARKVVSGAGADKRFAPGTSAAAVDFSARAWTDLFSRVLLAAFSNQGTDRPERDPSGGRLSAGCFRR